MDITPSSIRSQRSGSRSRTRNSTANSRSTSSSRRPSLNGRRSISSSSVSRLVVTPTAIDALSEKTIPTVTFSLDNSLPLEFFKEDLAGLIKALKISKWRKVPLAADNISVSRISGALTNSIYRISYKGEVEGIQPPKLLLRVYGKNVDSLIDRDTELETLKRLSSNKIGPRLLGIFCNGRFEQFLDGFVTLGKEDIRDPVISQVLGRRMKDLHYNIELQKTDLQLEFPQCWLQILKWLSIIEKDILPQMAPKAVQDTLLMPWSDFKSLVFVYRDWLFSKYDLDNFNANYRFCHNDTQYGNLLLKDTFDPREVIESTAPLTTHGKKDTDLAVIDFEYSGANFPAYDIADHFSEWMADYHDPEKSYYIHEDKFPTQAEQLNLIKSYVEYNFHIPSSNLKIKTNLTELTVKELIELEMKKLFNETLFWRPAVQIFWLAWGLIQNGPQKDPLDELTSKTEGQGVTGKYEFSTGLDALDISQNSAVIEEDAIVSTDDDFDYLKYCQQKAALIVGDASSFGILNVSDISPEYHNIVKFLDTRAFDI